MEMGTHIEFENVFQHEEHFFTFLVNRVFTDLQISGDIDDIDYHTDFGKRIFITMTDGKEYTIRTWNIHDNDNTVFVDYSLYFPFKQLEISKL